VSIEWRVLYLALYYVPIWIANVLTIGIYIWTGREIIQSRKQLQRAVFDAESPEQHQNLSLGSSTPPLLSSHDAESEFMRESISLSGELSCFYG
jgi:hypothetical protein